MNRRDVLKALGALPIASAWAGCRHDEPEPAPKPTPESSGQVHTLQILLEGTFAVVLQRTTQRLIAFVPRPDPARADLAHHFCYNDPRKREDLGTNQKPKSYEFHLPQDGLRRYPDSRLFVNSDFNDFRAETKVWNHPPSLVSLDLPFPRSINFSGRPLHVTFAKNALKHEGKMPTNAIIEYVVDDAAKVGMKCEQMGGRAPSSPNCPPGIMRYYFGVGPDMSDPDGQRKHAVAFFNFMLATSFPLLREKYALADIEPADYPHPQDDYNKATSPTAYDETEAAPALAPAVLQSSSQKPRLRRVASLVDCQSGPMTADTNSPASGH